jgi:polysaccharide export outer membrane protein
MRVNPSQALHRGIVATAFATILAFASAGTALAEFRLSPGDTVEVVVTAGGEQRYRASIQADGSITLPVAGSVVIEGLTPAEFQARMEALLPTKIFRYRTPDGREQSLLVKPADITTSVVEYRPVYISGDILTPGQQAYRPLMTVRQVVAVAGGYSMLRSRAALAGADPVELRREYETVSIEYAKEFFHAARVRAELEDKKTLEQQLQREVSVAGTVISAIVDSEAKLLQAGQADVSAEQVFLEDSIKKSDEQLGVLKEQEEGEAKGVESDAQELDRALKLFGSGTLVGPRVTEARRAQLLSSTRHLQTMVEVMRLQRVQDEQRRQLVRIDAQRKMKLQAEFNDANVRLAESRARLQAARQRLQPLGAAGPVPMGEDNFRPDVVVVRKVGQKWARLAAAEDFDVEPGDVIEVALRSEGFQRPSQ